MSTSEVMAFVQKIGPLVVTEGYRRGYKVYSTPIAQAIIESRYGMSGLAQRANNFFGLKCGTAWLLAGKPSINMRTNEEFTVGKLTQVSAFFRKYPDMESGVKGYYDFISTRRYANLKDALTYEQYARYLKEDGYATSSTYVDTLCKTAVAYGLIAFDQGLSPVPKAEWLIGWDYTTQQDLNVREEPNGRLLTMDDLTEDGRKHAFIGPSGNAILRRGTKVTVRDVQSTGTCTWIRIPSGWICAKNSKNIFVL